MICMADMYVGTLCRGEFSIHPDLSEDWLVLKDLIKRFDSPQCRVDIKSFPKKEQLSLSRLLRRAKANGKRAWCEGETVSLSIAFMALEYLFDVNQHHVRQSRERRLS